jgi:hypothetical protein
MADDPVAPDETSEGGAAADAPMRGFVPLINALVGLLAGLGLACGNAFETRPTPRTTEPLNLDFGPAALFLAGALVWLCCVSVALTSAVRVLWTNRQPADRFDAKMAFVVGLIGATLPWWPTLYRWATDHFRFS